MKKNQTLTTFSIQNSRNMTLPERILWFQILKSRKLNNLKFIKQKVISKYIVDFYCPELKLIIELDGLTHESSSEQDRIRDNYLSQNGYQIIRIKNSDILNNIDGVYEYLKSLF
ncbi:MAG: endonuclease domain-containing protein [Patescibacteria group bacterium]